MPTNQTGSTVNLETSNEVEKDVSRLFSALYAENRPSNLRIMAETDSFHKSQDQALFFIDLH